MSRVFPIVFVLLLLMAAQVAGQNLPIRHYTVEEGLPSNVVYSVYRDSKGYIWVCTDKGVARCNGLKFEIFSTFNGLPDNEIFFVKEDHYGRIWFGTFNGALCYYKDGLFFNAGNTSFLRHSFVQPHIRHISNQYDSSIIISYAVPTHFLVVGKDYCREFDLAKLKRPDVSATFAFAQKISDNKYKLICGDKVVFIDTSYHLLGVKNLRREFHNPGGTFTSCQDQDRLFNDSCFFPFGMEYARASKTLVYGAGVHEIYADGKDVYYATVNGLIVNDTLNLIKDNNVSAITQDYEQNYWISTLNNGVFVLKKNYLQSKFYQNIYTGVAKYAYAKDDVLYFATADNNLYKLENGRTSCLFNYAQTKREPYNYPTDFGFFIDSDLSYFNVYKNDLTTIDDLRHVKARTREVKSLNGAKEIYRSGDYLYIKQPRYISKVKAYGHDHAGEPTAETYANQRVFHMAKAPDNSIWYSTIDKLYRLTNSDSDGVPQTQFKNISLKYFSMFNDHMVGYTHNNLMLVFSDYTGANIKIDTVSPRNCIWDKIYRVDDGHVLMSTSNQYRLLSKNPRDSTKRFSVRPIEDPFIPLHAEAICCDGRNWYFLKNGCITVVNREDLLVRSDPPKLFFTGLNATGTHVPVKDGMSLSFSESRSMTLSFSALTFSGNDVVCQYSFSKDGEDMWQDVKGDQIYLVGVSAGDYVIKLRARTLSSVYCSPIVFSMHICKPFWLTWWFLTVVCIGLALITGGIVRYRIHRLLRKKQKEHEKEIRFLKSEYKSLNALMNPHFIFNTLNNVQGLVNRDDKLAANEYIRVFADLIRQNMHNISKELIPLQNEINLVANYLSLEKLRFKENLSYAIDIEGDLDMTEIMVPPLLVQPLVENSIKHGIYPMVSGGGMIKVRIFERDDVLFIDVMDNGVGLKAAKESKRAAHESFGLENIKKRIDQLSVILNKQILFNIGETKDSNGVSWTLVTISIPITVK